MQLVLVRRSCGHSGSELFLCPHPWLDFDLILQKLGGFNLTDVKRRRGMVADDIHESVAAQGVGRAEGQPSQRRGCTGRF